MIGTETEDTDCPFKALHREREKETLSSSFFTASKVQGVGSYLACDKPRCLYCDKLVTSRPSTNSDKQALYK